MSPFRQALSWNVPRTLSRIARIAPVILLVAMSGTSLLFMMYFQTCSELSARTAEARSTTTNLAHALEQNAQDKLALADAVVGAVGVQWQRAAARQPGFESVRTLARRQLQSQGVLSGVFLLDAHGTDHLHLAGAAAPDQVALRQSALYHRTRRGTELHVGMPVQVLGSDTDWLLPVSRRYEGENGQAVVVLVLLKLSHFQNYYEHFDVGAGGTMMLVLDNGTVLARYPKSERSVGQNMADGVLFRSGLMGQDAGSAALVSQQDGIERIYRYTRVAHYPLVVAVGLSTESVYGGWAREARWRGASIILLLLSLGVLGLDLARRNRASARGKAKLFKIQQELEARNEELKHLVMEDPLTGLANRRRFDQDLRAEFSRAMRNGSVLALIMIDVDHFKSYNDTYGHPAGDDCLRIISAVVQASQSRAGDLAVRYGGEELAVLLPHTDLAGATTVAEKIRRSVAKLRLPHAGNPEGFVTVSLGVNAFVPVRFGHTQQQLVDSADKALYLAKMSGRNRVCCGETIAPLAPAA